MLRKKSHDLGPRNITTHATPFSTIMLCLFMSRNPETHRQLLEQHQLLLIVAVSRVRIVYLGTGTRSNDLPPPQRDHLAHLVSGFIRIGQFMKRALTKFAVNSELTASKMTTLGHVSRDSVSYERFSANNGVCHTELDKYKQLDNSKTLTRYLQTSMTRSQLRNVGEQMAKDFSRNAALKQQAGQYLPRA